MTDLENLQKERVEHDAKLQQLRREVQQAEALGCYVTYAYLRNKELLERLTSRPCSIPEAWLIEGALSEVKKWDERAMKHHRG